MKRTTPVYTALLAAGLMLPTAQAETPLPLLLSADKLSANNSAANSAGSPATTDLIVKLKPGKKWSVAAHKNDPTQLLAASTTQAISDSGARIKKLLPHLGMAILQTDQPLAPVMDKLQRSAEVAYVAPSIGRKPMGQLIPNDTIFTLQSGFHTSDEISLINGKPPVPDADINAPEAWEIRTDASNVLVAIIDTGLNYKDPELAGNVWVNPGEIADNGLDDDNNGYVDDVYGINAVLGTSDPMDDFGHGTYVANLIANKGNNGIGSAGVAWNAKVLGLMAYESRFGHIYDAALLESLEYVLALKAANKLPRVILNISFGSTMYSQALHDALETMQQAGVLMLAAAGDLQLNNDVTPFYPASAELDAMLAVTSSDPLSGRKASKASWGCSAVELTAPGEYAAFSNNGQTQVKSGTSFATAMATGIAALTWAEHPDWDWREVKNALMASGKPMPGLEGISISQGIVQADRALTYQSGTPSVWGQYPGIGVPGDQVTIKGSHFGTQSGVVRLAGHSAKALDIVSWQDREIVARLPADTPYGQQGLVVSKPDGSSSGQSCYLVSAEARPVATLHTPRSDAAIAAVGKDIWVFGGMAFQGTTASVEKFTPHITEVKGAEVKSAEVVSNSQWTMPTAVMGAAAGVINNKVYIAGGASFSYSVQNKVQIFNPADQSWAAGAPAPQGFFLAASAVYQDKLYVFGGLTSFLHNVLRPDAISDAVLIYDPAKDSWSRGPAMPLRLYAPAAVADPTGEGIILTGGRHGTDEQSMPLANSYRFNPKDGRWTSLPAMKTGRYVHQMIADQQSVYSLFGQSADGTSDNGEIFTGGQWQPAIKADTGFYEVGAAALNGQGYLVGGIGLLSEGGYLSTTFSNQIRAFALHSKDTPAQGANPGTGTSPGTGNNTGNNGTPAGGAAIEPPPQQSGGATGGWLLPLLALTLRRRPLTKAVQAALGLLATAGTSYANTPASVVLSANPAANAAAKGAQVQQVASSAQVLLVKFSDAELVQSFAASAGARADEAALPASIRQALAAAGAKVQQVFPHSGLVAVQTDHPVGAAIEALLASGQVEYAVPSFPRQQLSTYPADPEFAAQWGLENIGQTVGGNSGLPDQDINAPEGWDKRTSARNVVVAVLDDNFFTEHPDLKANVWVNPTEIAGNGLDDDNNGYVDDIHGVNTSLVTGGHYSSYSSHASAVAGIIGAVGNNGIGIAGVAWQVQLMNLAALDDIGIVINDLGVVRAIEYLIATKQRLQLPRVILNMSWGGPQYSPALADALKAAEAAGILLVAAAGNNADVNVDTQPNYPGNLPLDALVNVGGYDSTADRWSPNSAYGCNQVDLAAPGGDTYSLGNQYEAYWTVAGTSMASAYISGAAALLWEEHPKASALEIKAALLHGAQPAAGLASYNLTGGRFRLDRAFAAGIAKPTVWQVSPFTAAPGKKVTLRGRGFGETPGSVKLRDLQSGAEVAAEVRSWKATEVEIQLPYDMPYSDRAAIVSTPQGTSNPGCLLVSENAYSIGEMAYGRHNAAYAQVGDDLWVFGGEAWAYQDYGAQYTSNIERFNVKTRASIASSKVKLPKALFGARAVAIGRKIYLVGGVVGKGFGQWDMQNSLLVFDTESQSFEEKAPLPVALAQAGVAVIDGQIHVFGGNIGQYPANKASGHSYIYDPVRDRWSKGADLLLPVIDPGVDVNPSTGQASVIGGFVVDADFAPPVAVPNMQVFDPAHNSWTMGPSMKHPRYGMGVLRFKDQIIAVSGYGSPGKTQTWAHAETLIDGHWQLTTRLGMELGDPAVAVGAEEGFVLGGQNITYGGDRQMWAFPLQRAQAPAPTPAPVVVPPAPAPATSSGGAVGWLVLLLGWLRLRRS